MRGYIWAILLPLVCVGATPAANFAVSPDEANSYGCGPQCQQILKNASTADISGMGYDFDFDFYQTASNFSGSIPGDLLKLQAMDPIPLQINPGTTVYRMQYTSRDLDNATVPVTGFIAFPYSANSAMYEYEHLGRSNDNRFRLAAYAHGTSGLYRGCAPSNGPSLFDYNTWQLLIARGYAVVATDYAGLGNNYTTHKYLSANVQAADVYYSVLAARKAFGSLLSDEWISIGHSQGGGAVWSLAESDFVNDPYGKPRNGYLGTVALAPGTRLTDSTLHMMKNITFPGYVPLLAIGLQRFRPDYNLSLLGNGLLKRVPLMKEAQLCALGVISLTFDLSPQDAVSVEGLLNTIPLLQEWQNKTSAAVGRRSFAPILVLQGLNDTTVSPWGTRNSYDAACGFHNEIQLREYPGIDHSALVGTSGPEWLAWMDARFMGLRTSGHCSSTIRKAFDIKHVKAPVDFNLTLLGL